MKNSTFWLTLLMIAMAICLVWMYCTEHRNGYTRYGVVKDSIMMPVDTGYEGLDKEDTVELDTKSI